VGEARYQDGKVVVEDPRAVEALSKRGFGSREGGRLVLEPWEALYLVEKGRIEVSERGRKLGFQELLRRFEQLDKLAWAKYLIYRDLRERGYVVKSGFGPRLLFRLYERGEYGKKAAKYLIYGVLEGSPVKFSALEEALRMAQSSKKELVLAVVDRRGEVVYYSLSGWIKPEPGGSEK